MKVKIGDKIHDASKEPIMFILTQKDKENISEMHSENFLYCGFPEAMTEFEAKIFMGLISDSKNHESTKVAEIEKPLQSVSPVKVIKLPKR